MSSISNKDQDSVEDIFEEYEIKNTDYIKEQLEFMESITVGYPDGTTIYWEEEASERYEGLVESFGEVNEYVGHLDNGAVAVFVEQDDEPLFVVYGEEQSNSRNDRFGFSNVVDTLSG